MTEAHVSEYKKKVVGNLVDLIRKYPIIGIVNMENLPAPQLQHMRAQLRKNAVLTMTKRRLVRIAFEQAEKEKKGIENLNRHLGGMPALIFTNDNPFKLSRTLDKSKSPAPAKPGQIAPKDIIISKGSTPFAPGPFIAELSVAGIKSGIEGGKIAIKEDTVVAKKGDKIKPKVAEILIRLGIQPMEVGLGLEAVYEHGLIYTKDILSISEIEYINRISKASRWAFNLAMFAQYPTKSTIGLLLANAHRDAKILGIERKIFDKGIIEILLGKAESQMLSLKDTANLQVSEAKKPQDEPEEKKGVEEKQEHTPEEEKEASRVAAIQKEFHGIRVPSARELEENIKRRNQERDIKEVEKITKDIVRKHALGGK